MADLNVSSDSPSCNRLPRRAKPDDLADGGDSITLRQVEIAEQMASIEGRHRRGRPTGESPSRYAGGRSH
jgi:hypothetical protein